MGWKGNRGKPGGLGCQEQVCLDGFVPCCQPLAGGFLGRGVNKSCSVCKAPKCFDVVQLLRAAAHLPLIHPTLLFVLLDSTEVKEGFVTSQT